MPFSVHLSQLLFLLSRVIKLWISFPLTLHNQCPHETRHPATFKQIVLRADFPLACECRGNSSCCLSLLKVTFLFFSRDTEIRLCLQAGFALLSPLTTCYSVLLFKGDPDAPMTPPLFASLFKQTTHKSRGFSKFLCRRSVGFFSQAFLVFLMKENCKKRRRKQAGKLMAKSRSQPVNLVGAQLLMNPLQKVWRSP